MNQKLLFILTCSFILLPNIQLSVFAQVNKGNNNLPIVSQSLSQNNIKFKICSESETWVRPTAAEQKNHLASFNGRYSPEEIAALGGDYWKYKIFAFSSFPGGSGTFDIGHLSGLWKSQDTKKPANCDDYVSQLDAAKSGAALILNYKIVGIKWINNRYIVQVKSIKRCWQQVQFYRRDNSSSLPLIVVDEKGRKVPVLFYK
ncbi:MULTISPECIES: hypothetical protein [Calothrix]|uniref:DNA/RNA non-specific endonuclease n=2 Tax=Calothrix TaxID=1186 RepID=A0ABR8AMK5_9CYAN|nr:MULTISPECIES: hypothetical protein [Calothrix]MBD2199901.1 hypothetical protein [Calothrix parietina FACHB-288]MBD2228752.1 hypothetical protein [Calothrix anomala FACHB-343]